MPSGETDPRRSEPLLRAVLDSMSQPVVAIGESGTIEFVNRQSEITFGYSAGELAGQPVEMLVPPRYREKHQLLATSYVRKSSPSRTAMHLVWAIDRTGREFPIDVHLNHARMEDGRKLGIALITDLSEPELLRQQREDFFRVAPDLLVTLTPEGNLDQVNPAFTKLLGWTAEELKTRSLASLAHPDERTRAERILRSFLAGDAQESPGAEIRCVCRDGSTRCIDWALHTTESGSRIAAGRDVTKSRILALERHKLAAVVGGAPMLVAILASGRDLAVQHLNPSGRDLLGLMDSKPLPATGFCELCGLDAVTAARIETGLELQGKWSGTVELIHTKTFAPIPVDLDIVGIVMGTLDTNPVLQRPMAWGAFARDIRERRRNQELLEESEERFRTLLEQATDPLFVHDRTGQILEVNRQACEDLGYTREELLGMKAFEVETLKAPEDLGDLWDSAVPGKPVTSVGRLKRKDGSHFPVEARVGVCVLRGKRLFMALVRDMSEHLRNEERLRALTAQLMTAREEERRHIALELHDDFTQKLAVIGMETGLLRKSLGSEPDAGIAATLDSIRASIIALTDQMRELSHEYHPGMLEHAGLGAAAAAHCQEVSRYSGIPVTVHVRDLPEPLPLEISLTLYRILQEALRNVIRHSGSEAAHVFISGLVEPRRVVLAVVDHGKGFLIEDIRNGSGLGLLGIEERTRLVRGVLRLSSIPGEGTRLEVEIPLPPPPQKPAREIEKKEEEEEAP